MSIGHTTSSSGHKTATSPAKTGGAKKKKKTGKATKSSQTKHKSSTSAPKAAKSLDKAHVSHEAKSAQPAANNQHTNALSQNFGAAPAKKSGRPDPMNPAPGGPTGVHKATGTGYFPANNSMEGGFKDRRDNKLATLQDFMEGKSKYVSVAMDKKQNIPYGKPLTIKEMDAKYADQLKAMGKEHIDFRVVDTGGAFTNKGTGRIDIATRNNKASLDKTINGPLTLDFGKE